MVTKDFIATFRGKSFIHATIKRNGDKFSKYGSFDTSPWNYERLEGEVCEYSVMPDDEQKLYDETCSYLVHTETSFAYWFLNRRHKEVAISSITRKKLFRTLKKIGTLKKDIIFLS